MGNLKVAVPLIIGKNVPAHAHLMIELAHVRNQNISSDMTQERNTVKLYYWPNLESVLQIFRHLNLLANYMQSNYQGEKPRGSNKETILSYCFRTHSEI